MWPQTTPRRAEAGFRRLGVVTLALSVVFAFLPGLLPFASAVGQEPSPEPPDVAATVWPDTRISGNSWQGADIRIDLDKAPPDGIPDDWWEFFAGTEYSPESGLYYDGGFFEVSAPFQDGTRSLDSGDVVTVTASGGAIDGTVKALTVRALTVTDIDDTTGIISGTAASGDNVVVVRFGDDFGNPHDEVAATNLDGNWSATLSGVWPGSSGEAAITDDDGDRTRADWGSPFIVAGIDVDGEEGELDVIFGGFWYLDDAVTLSTTGATPFNPETVPTDDEWWRGFSVSLTDLAVGDLVTAAGDLSGTIRSHTVLALSVDGWTDWQLDGSGNEVFGTTSAAVGSWVRIEVHGRDATRTTTVAADGSWVVDFDDEVEDQEPIQIGLGVTGRVEVVGPDGGRTFAPWGEHGGGGGLFIAASVADQMLEGHGWDGDATVTIGVSGCGDPRSWPVDGEELWVSASEVFPDGCVLAPGQIFTVSGDDTSRVREMTISALVVLEVDVDASEVRGTAAPGSEIEVTLDYPEGDPPAARTVEANGDGSWTAEFAVPIDPGDQTPAHYGTHVFDNTTAGNTVQYDGDEDLTWSQWHVLHPQMFAMALHNVVFLFDWAVGTPITLAVYDDDTSPELLYTTTVTPEGGRFNQELWLPLSFDLQSGQLLEATNGTDLRSLPVSSLSVHEVDFDAADVIGIAEPGVDVFVGVGNDAGEQEALAASDAFGDWIADFPEGSFGNLVGGAAIVFGDSVATLVQFVAEHITAVVGAEGSLGTGDGTPTPDDPIQAGVVMPEGGEVTLTETDVTGTVEDGWQLLGSRIEATSTVPGTVAGPLELFFLLDASIIPDGEDETSLMVFRNGVLVPECAAVLDDPGDFPCVFSRSVPDSGNIKIVVLTLELSRWHVAVRLTAPPVGLGEIAAPVDAVPVDTPVDVTATFSSVPDGTAVATWYWDGLAGPTTPGTVDGNGVVHGDYTYPQAGVHRVALRVDVPDASANTQTYWRYHGYIVVYDPDGPFVTGGGWIDSPAGAYVADPQLLGHANFGFVSKYKKGATTPSGNTEFHFKAGELNFHSDSYDWMVIAGQDRAKYKGTGTINGTGSYGFMLTAIDNDNSGDTFRIKIWDKDAGDALVYDNQSAADDASYDGTIIGGGNIKVHKGK